MANDDIVHQCTGFEWDEGNTLKNWERHRVSASECEQVFFNRPLTTVPDVAHSVDEPRFYALGRTDAERHIFVAFTVRNNLIRVISARDMSRKERKAFEDYEKDSEIQNGS
jgi:uncharacterized DUF497 family protein